MKAAVLWNLAFKMFKLVVFQNKSCERGLQEGGFIGSGLNLSTKKKKKVWAQWFKVNVSLGRRLQLKIKADIRNRLMVKPGESGAHKMHPLSLSLWVCVTEWDAFEVCCVGRLKDFFLKKKKKKKNAQKYNPATKCFQCMLYMFLWSWCSTGLCPSYIRELSKLSLSTLQKISTSFEKFLWETNQSTWMCQGTD